MIESLFPKGDIRRPHHMLRVLNEVAMGLARHDLEMYDFADLSYSEGASPHYHATMHYTLPRTTNNTILVEANIKMRWWSVFETLMDGVLVDDVIKTPDDTTQEHIPQVVFTIEYECPMDAAWRPDDIKTIGTTYLELSNAFPQPDYWSEWTLFVPVYFEQEKWGLDYLRVEARRTLMIQEICDAEQRIASITALAAEVAGVMRWLSAQPKLPDQNRTYSNIR